MALFWHGEQEMVEITHEVQSVLIQGVLVEVQVEAKGLRLAKLEVVSNQAEQHHNAVRDILHQLTCRRQDSNMLRQENEEINKLLETEGNEEVVAELESKQRDKQALLRQHRREIKRLEAVTAVQVNYQVGKRGVVCVIPAGSYEWLDFLPKPVCWCPRRTASPVDAVEEKSEAMPMSATCPEQTTASGPGLTVALVNQENTFVVTTMDAEGQRCTVGGDTFSVGVDGPEVQAAVVDQHNGTYQVTYNVGDSKRDTFALSIMCRGQHICGSPFAVTTSPQWRSFNTNLTLSNDARTLTKTGPKGNNASAVGVAGYSAGIHTWRLRCTAANDLNWMVIGVATSTLTDQEVAHHVTGKAFGYCTGSSRNYFSLEKLSGSNRAPVTSGAGSAVFWMRLDCDQHVLSIRHNDQHGEDLLTLRVPSEELRPWVHACMTGNVIELI